MDKLETGTLNIAAQRLNQYQLSNCLQATFQIGFLASCCGRIVYSRRTYVLVHLMLKILDVSVSLLGLDRSHHYFVNKHYLRQFKNLLFSSLYN